MAERILQGLEPERVFYYFEEISRIPRPSFKEKAISDYLVEFARTHGLSYEQDELYNVIMIRPAAQGYEDLEPVILQGHMDMVCEMEAGCTKDMEKEGLDLFVEEDLIGAKGTTLGADDGIAVAMMLALLEDEDLKAPRLECVFTASEEVGMDGAAQVDLSSCKGRRLLNIDSEVEQTLVAGCAGGGRFETTLPVEREKDPAGLCFLLTVSGLIGGHSGLMIHRGSANANMVMAQLLRGVSQELELRFVDMSGGEKDNVIPAEARVSFFIPESGCDRLKALIERESDRIKREYQDTDPCMEIQLEQQDPKERLSEMQAVTPADSRKIIQMMLSLPNGVIRMFDMKNQQVETSLNLGILHLDNDEFCMGYLLRSSVAAAYEALRENMRFMAEGYGAEVRIFGEYPAWEFRKDSPLRDRFAAIYREQNNKSQDVVCVHAGVECGFLAGKLPGLDVVSIGPDIFDIHTPKERLSISSVGRIYAAIREYLVTA